MNAFIAQRQENLTWMRKTLMDVDIFIDVQLDHLFPNRSLYSWIIVGFYITFYILIVVSSTILLWFYTSCNSGILSPLHESVTGHLYKNNIRLSFVLAVPLFLDVFLDAISLRRVDPREKHVSKQIVQCYTRFSLLALLVLPKLFLLFIDFGSYSAHAYIILNAYKLAAINGAFMAYVTEIDFVQQSESMAGLYVGRTCLLVLFTSAPAHYIGLLWAILEDPFYSKTGFCVVMFFDGLRLYGWYRGFSMLWQWWKKLQIQGMGNMTSSDISSTVYIGGFLLVWFLITLSSLWFGCYWNIFNTTPLCLSTYVYICLAFFLLALMLPTRISRMEITDEISHMQKETQDRQAFIRYISHEIRTPLNTTFLGLEFINTSLDQLSGRPFFKGNRAILPGLQREITPILETVGDIRSSCEIALGILNELLMFDKMATGKMNLDLEEINARQYFSSVTQPFHVNARQSDVAFTMDCEMGVPWKHLSIEVDVNKMGQVVRNLISNALKFTPKGGRVVVKLKTFEVVTTTTSSSSPQPSVTDANDANATSPLKEDASSLSETQTETIVPWVVLEVTDSGAGISEENQKKIFGQYVQFNASKLQKGGGSGLGLWISRGICELHGGRIGGRSDGEGMGSTFFLELPVHMRVPLDHTKSSSSLINASANASEVASVVSSSPEKAHGSQANNHTETNNHNNHTDNLINNDNDHENTSHVTSVNPPVEFPLNQESTSDANSERYDQFLASVSTDASSKASSKCPSKVGSTVASGASTPKIVSGMSTPIAFPQGMLEQQGTNTPLNDTLSLQFLTSELEKRLGNDGIAIRQDEGAPVDQNGSTIGIHVHHGKLSVGQSTAMRLASTINRGNLTNSSKNNHSFSNHSSTPIQTPPVGSTRVSSRTISRQASNPSSRVHSRAASPSSRDEEDFLSSAASFMQVNRQISTSRLSSGYLSRLTSPDMSMHNNVKAGSGHSGVVSAGLVSAVLSLDGSTSRRRGSLDGLLNWQQNTEANLINKTDTNKSSGSVSGIFPDTSTNVSALSSRIGSGNNTARSLNSTEMNETPDSTLVPAERLNNSESMLKSRTTAPHSASLVLPVVAENTVTDTTNYPKKDLSSSGKSSITNKSRSVNASIMMSTTEPVEDDDSTPRASPSRQLRFLVVDDTALTRKMVRRLLEFQDYLVLEATDGGNALEVFDEAKERGEMIDCVLMDYSMPVLCGSDATAALRAREYQGLVVGCTGLTAASDVQDFMNKGANAVLSKPLRFEALHAMVKDLL